MFGDITDRHLNAGFASGQRGIPSDNPDAIFKVSDSITSKSDFDRDNLTDRYDLAIWRSSYGIDGGGDADGDGDTDGRDLLAWQRSFNGDSRISGDFDGDDDVDGRDFLKWQRGELSHPLVSFDLAEWQENYPSIASGDFDFDGDVDGRDFLKWQRGESPNPLSASELADWQANYDNAETFFSPTTAVPEPANLVLLFLGFAGIRLRGHRAVTKAKYFVHE